MNLISNFKRPLKKKKSNFKRRKHNKKYYNILNMNAKKIQIFEWYS